MHFIVEKFVKLNEINSFFWWVNKNIAVYLKKIEDNLYLLISICEGNFYFIFISFFIVKGEVKEKKRKKSQQACESPVSR